MKELRCIVVDDEPLACKLVSSYVERTDGLTLVNAYTRASDAMDAIIEQHPDIVFLDIQMPELSGIDMAKHILSKTRIVFTTAYRDFAVEGFRVNALDYLLKPISYAEFLESVERARALSKDSDNDFITVKSEYRLVRIPVNDILYIEGLKDYIKIYVDGIARPVLTLMSMKSIEAMLPDDSFLRVHRSYIANTDKIRIVEQGRIVYGESRIPVSDSYKAQVMDRMKNR